MLGRFMQLMTNWSWVHSSTNADIQDKKVACLNNKMASDVLWVSTFDDQVFEFDKLHLTTIGNLKQKLAGCLKCDEECIRILFSGDELLNNRDVSLIDHVYACIVARTCFDCKKHGCQNNCNHSK